MKSGGRHLVIDPYLSDSLAEREELPHVRMMRSVIDPSRLDFVDVLAITHDHGDRFDPDTAGALLEASPTAIVIVPVAIRRRVVERLRLDEQRIIGLDDGVSVHIAGFHLTALASAHEELEQDEQGRFKHIGYVIAAGGKTVYHSGDTVIYDGLVDRLRWYSLDVALLPINGRSQLQGIVGNLTAAEAARLAFDCGAALAVPCHYDMFASNTGDPAAFADSSEFLGQAWRILEAGERLSV